MRNWGVEQHPFAVLGGGCHATVRGERGAVSLSGTSESVGALIEALTHKTEEPQLDAAKKLNLRAVFADGRGGVAAMTFEFPAGHELTLDDVKGLELFASEQVKATVIALSWSWLPVKEGAESTPEAPSTEPLSVLADPPSIGRVANNEDRKLRAVPPPQGDNDAPA